MDLFELFREKQIRITPESQVSVKYITAGTASDLFSLAEGDMLLVKKQITREDLASLKEYAWSVTVFSAQPDSLDTFDVQKELGDIAEVHHLETVGLNYLHFGKTLLVFGEFERITSDTAVPNAVSITPVRRDQIETKLAVDMEAIQSILEKHQPITDPDPSMPEQPGPVEKKTASRKSPSEIDMVREKLTEQFKERYSVVRTEFTGVSFESRQISLSEFYRDHGIAQGRLLGSWRLLDKERIGDSFDVGIARRAIDDVYRRLSVSVPGYGRIVRADKMPEFRNAMGKIEEDYRDYISGKTCRRIGGIEVTRPFAPWRIIEESFDALLDYLVEISPVKGRDTEGYIQDVKWFISECKEELSRVPEKVKLKITETSYKPDQWSDHSFVASMMRAAVNNRQVFDGEFIKTLKRYIDVQKASS